MAKNLVLYISAYGTAKAVAEEIVKQTGTDIMEIEPEVDEMESLSVRTDY